MDCKTTDPLGYKANKPPTNPYSPTDANLNYWHNLSSSLLFPSCNGEIADTSGPIDLACLAQPTFWALIAETALDALRTHATLCNAVMTAVTS